MGDWNTDVRNSIVAGQAITCRPFAKGNLTSDGLQYSTEVSGIAASGYISVEKVTMKNYVPGMLREIRFDLLGEVHTNSSDASILYKWQGSDDNSTWKDLCSAQTTSSSTYKAVRIAGNYTTSSGFLVSGNTFYVRMVAQANSGDYVYARTASSSQVIMIYD